MTGIVVNVSTTVKIDLKLEVGQITERVEVTAAAPPVVSERSDLGAVVTTKTIIDLPLSLSATRVGVSPLLSNTAHESASSR